MSEYFTFLWSLISGGLIVLAGLTFLDFVVGVIASLVKKDFKWVYLMHYVNTDLVPIFGWIIVVILTTIPTGLVPPGGILPVTSGAVYATVFLSILASILQSLKEVGVLTDTFGKIGI